mgnify:CR=1 FL=1
MIGLDTLSSLGLTQQNTTTEAATEGALQQEDFLELMVAQFSNQDPFKPMENGDFLGQLAQFGTVSGIEELQNSFETVASSLYSDQALQASTLIDHEVLAPGNVGVLDANGTLKGAVELANSAVGIDIRITDAAGVQVGRVQLPTQGAGLARFEWNGLNEAGQPVAPGQYRIEAVATGNGINEQLPVLVQAKVDSVSLGGGGGVLLDLEGLGELGLNEVRRIGSANNSN